MLQAEGYISAPGLAYDNEQAHTGGGILVISVFLIHWQYFISVTTKLLHSIFQNVERYKKIVAKCRHVWIKTEMNTRLGGGEAA
jgi:hypothetical protein